MKDNFWHTLKKPLMILAPMADVTDAPFRRIIAAYGKPDVMFTEFTSADGMCSPGKDKVEVNLWYSESERPIVAQIFSSRPEHCYTAAVRIKELGFDGIDINMGCPDRSIEKQGAGAAMIKNPQLAYEVIQASKEGAGGLPVSVKTRIGYNNNELETWLPTILATGISAITIHGRTRKEMSKVPADWDVIARAGEIVRAYNRAAEGSTLIIGNGDVDSIEEGVKKAKEYGVDGVMIGRGIFGNPWLFRRDGYAPTIEERLRVCAEHTKLFEELFAGKKPFHIMKKHYKAYVSGFDGAKELRMKMMEAQDAKEVEEIIKKCSANFSGTRDAPDITLSPGPTVIH